MRWGGLWCDSSLFEFFNSFLKGIKDRTGKNNWKYVASVNIVVTISALRYRYLKYVLAPPTCVGGRYITRTPPNNNNSHEKKTEVMASSIPPNKRQKRQDYLAAAKAMATTELPKKKFYRQRAHANPFSDHQLT